MGRFDMLPSIAASVFDHLTFGPLRAPSCPADGIWRWEALELLSTARGRADLSFDAGPGGPGDAHEAQLATLIAQLDRLTAAAAPAIRSALPECVGLSLADPWAQLEWQGAHLTGEEGAFNLHYACKSWPEALIIVRFERSVPVLVQIES